MKFLKYSIVLFIVCAAILLLKLTIFYPTEKQIVWDVATTEKIIELPNSPYECVKMKAVIGEDVNFCKLQVARPVQIGKPTVMGDFNSYTNTVRITQETSNDAIVHEFIHYAIDCTRKTNNEELCVRSAQKLSLDLNLIK